MDAYASWTTDDGGRGRGAVTIKTGGWFHPLRLNLGRVRRGGHQNRASL